MIAFRFFIEIELCVPTYPLSCKRHSEVDFTENVHDNVFSDDNVQIYWTLLSQDILDSDCSDTLLNGVIKLWITSSVFSID